MSAPPAYVGIDRAGRVAGRDDIFEYLVRWFKSKHVRTSSQTMPQVWGEKSSYALKLGCQLEPLSRETNDREASKKDDGREHEGHVDLWCRIFSRSSTIPYIEA